MQQQNMGERTPQGTPRHAGPKPLNTPEELRAIGLAIPSVTRIFMGLREKGYPVGENVYTVEQAAARLLPLLKGGETHA